MVWDRDCFCGRGVYISLIQRLKLNAQYYVKIVLTLLFENISQVSFQAEAKPTMMFHQGSARLISKPPQSALQKKKSGILLLNGG